MISAAIHEMVHLAIETTGRAGSIAVLRGQRVLSKLNLDPSLRTAASLAPRIDEAVEHFRAQGTPVVMISVADGPGSFTGLRIGVTTAKTLSYALRLPLVAVDSLSSIAAAAFVTNPSVDNLCVGIDAYRGQVYSGLFRRSELLPDLDQPAAASDQISPNIAVFDRGQWLNYLESLPADLHFAGDAKPLASRSAKILARDCDAVGTGLLALRAGAAMKFVDPLSLVPRYLKVSAAEEHWLPN